MGISKKIRRLIEYLNSKIESRGLLGVSQPCNNFENTQLGVRVRWFELEGIFPYDF